MVVEGTKRAEPSEEGEKGGGESRSASKSMRTPNQGTHLRAASALWSI